MQVHAQTNLPVYDSFGWPDGERLRTAASSVTLWSVGNSPGTGSQVVHTTNALSYPGLQTADKGASQTNTPATSNRQAGIWFNTFTFGSSTPALYASFLLTVHALPTNSANERIIFSIASNSGSGTTGPDTGSTALPLYLKTDGTIGIHKLHTTAPAVVTTEALQSNITYFIVLRYQWVDGANNDEVALWVNPAGLGAAEGSVPTPTLTYNGGGDMSAAASVWIMARAGVSGLIGFDEVRVDTTWAGVTPTTPPPGTIYTVSGGGSTCTNASFPVNLSGSDVGVDYWLMFNGVYSTTVAGTGSAISFGNQSQEGVYRVVGTNATTGTSAYMDGSATISYLDEPSIVVQPVPVEAVANSQATLSVWAVNDGLTFRWRKNGVDLVDGGNISGATSSNLVIYPVGAGDAASAGAGYDCVVSGTCDPAAVSTRVAFTVRAAKSLFWQGESPGANLWNMSAALFLDSGTFANTNCGFGDTVNIDPSWALSGFAQLDYAFLSPGRINVLIPFTFTGGALVGPMSLAALNGNLLMNGGNSFTGGTIISNTLVTINANGGLGTGTISLGSGTLNISNAITLGNDVSILGTSMIKVNNTSSSSLVMNGNLSGTGGTLTFANGTGSMPTIRVANSNIVFGRPIDLDNFNQMTPNGSSSNFFLAFYNNGGEQVFSGIISCQGPAQVQRRQSGGSTVLSGQNTYNNGLLIRGGNLGFGANSTPTTPGPITSGPAGTSNIWIDVAGDMGVYASGGARTIANPLVYITNTVNFDAPLVFTGSNDLTFSGSFDLLGSDRRITVENTGKSIISGVITNGGIYKDGPGTLTLNGVNVYTGSTVVTNGAVGGTGTIAGPVTVTGQGALAPGLSIGVLTINNSLTFDGSGGLVVEVNTGSSPTSDRIDVSGTLSNTGTGTVTVTNLGPALSEGTTFTLFNKAVANGNTMTITGGDVNWVNNLAVNGTITVGASGPPPSPVITSVRAVTGNLIFSGTNGTAGQGYTVLSTTNVATPKSSWVVESSGVFDGSGNFSVTNAITPGGGQKFYLLRRP